MKAKGPVWCPPSLRGSPQQEIWVKRGGQGNIRGNSGPTGRKMRPAAVQARAASEAARPYLLKNRLKGK